MSKLFVARLSPKVTQDDLSGLFSKYGKISYINMKTGYAFVQFESIDEAQTAARALDGTKIGDDIIVVETSNEAFRRSGPPASHSRHRYDSNERRRYDDRDRRYRDRRDDDRYRYRERSDSRDRRSRSRSPRRHRRHDDHTYSRNDRYRRDNVHQKGCFQCGEFGHIARSCPKIKESRQISPMLDSNHTLEPSANQSIADNIERSPKNQKYQGSPSPVADFYS